MAEVESKQQRQQQYRTQVKRRGSCIEMAIGGGGEDGVAGNDVTLIFVYGTLKRGFYNHRLIDDLMRPRHAVYLGPHTTVQPFPLVCGPHGIPYLINLPGCGHRVLGELYSVSSGHARSRLDDLEGVHQGHYERLPIVVVDGGERVVEVEAYFAHRGFGEALWKRCGEEGLSEFSVEMGQKYVRREDRPPHSNFIGDIHKFISEAN
ncbi:putative gamma-glutamylcyclotransferase At3g02910 [Sesamum indicum]|uniref:Gamma-glutamylcyclotransferase family protein n=1 Tax=Sesamum indicum TaxID=4182 RepID=A0A8M8UR05_SESIN|nr:putative gamma-glutamylcyclotransferase At3g02910 [Sesamum indicum]